MSRSVEVTAVANEAVDQLQCAVEYLSWFDSISWAIKKSLEQGHVHHAQSLAGAAQYLACDYHNLLDDDVKRMNDRLKTLDLRV